MGSFQKKVTIFRNKFFCVDAVAILAPGYLAQTGGSAPLVGPHAFLHAMSYCAAPAHFTLPIFAFAASALCCLEPVATVLDMLPHGRKARVQPVGLHLWALFSLVLTATEFTLWLAAAAGSALLLGAVIGTSWNPWWR